MSFYSGVSERLQCLTSASLAVPGLFDCPVEASVAAWLYKFKFEPKGEDGDELGESEYRA